jgi:hypothetical protein
MPTTDWMMVTTGVSSPSSGQNAWSNPQYITSDIGLFLVYHYDNLGGGAYSAYLIGTGLDFSTIPAGSTINGIEVRIKGFSAQFEHARVQLRYNGAGVGNVLDVGTDTGGFRDYDLGSSSDLWGWTPTADQIKNSTFGVQLRLYNIYPKDVSGNSAFDYFKVRITYTQPASPPVVTDDSATGTAGTASTKQMSATNTPTSWSLPYNPPTGVSINNSGLVSWNTSTAAGSYSISVAAFNAGGSGLGTLSLTMNSPSAPSVLNPSSLTGVINRTFLTTISGDNSPTSYNATLPSWLSVNTGTGLVSGLPPVGVNKNVNLIFYAINSNGSGSKNITLSLSKSPEASGFFTKSRTSRPYSQGGKTIFSGGTIMYQSGNQTVAQPDIGGRLDQFKYYGD